MNTAVDLEFRNSRDEKSYMFKFFSKGKIVITGLNCPFEQSEASNFANSLISAICKHRKINHVFPSTIKNTLSNFSSTVNIQKDHLIDIA